jgi:hypothetical protein
VNNTLTLKDRTYTFGTIPALEAIGVEVAIARVVGEPLFKAFADAKNGGKVTAEAMAAGAAAIGLLTAKMDKAELIETMTTVFKYVGHSGKPNTNIDADFTGRNKELWTVFIAALKFNFADFLPDGLSALPQSAAA